MTSSELFTIVPAVLVPIVTAVVGALGVQLQDWRRRRSRAARRRVALDDASKHITLVSQWWEASASVGVSPEELTELRGRARQWLDDAARLGMDAEPARVDEPATRMARRLLLLVPLDQPAARRVRVVFYLVLGVWIVVLGGAMRDALAVGHEYLSFDLGASVVLGLMSILVGFWVVSLENSARPGGAWRPGMARALLLYPLHQWWPRTVRVLFYGLAAGTATFIAYAVKTAWANPMTIPFLLANACVLVGYCIGLCAWVVSVDPPVETPRPGRVSTWLLFYPFRTRRGMAVRAAFYLVLVLAALIFFGIVSDVLGRVAPSDVAVGFGLVVVVGLAAVVLQKWAVVTESAADDSRPGTTLERILLIYGFKSRTASILRGPFYATVLSLGLACIEIVADSLAPTMASNAPLSDTAQEIAVLLLASTALWTCAVLLNRRRTTAPTNREQLNTPTPAALATSLVPTVKDPTST